VDGFEEAFDAENGALAAGELQRFVLVGELQRFVLVDSSDGFDEVRAEGFLDED